MARERILSVLEGRDSGKPGETLQSPESMCGFLRGELMPSVNVQELLNIASEQAANWMDIWQVFIFVEAALLAAVISMRKSLRGKYDWLMLVGYVAFWVAHGVTILRHFWVFDEITDLMDTVDPGEVYQELLSTLAPPPLGWVTVLYVIVGALTVRLIFREGALHQGQESSNVQPK